VGQFEIARVIAWSASFPPLCRRFSRHALDVGEARVHVQDRHHIALPSVATFRSRVKNGAFRPKIGTLLH
jgi:hypothetical protein